jgi:hypothetical protein
MSKITTSLLVASGLFVALLLIGVAVQPASTAYAAGDEQVLSAPEQDEDIVYVDPYIDDKADATPAPQMNQDVGSSATVTGIAVPISPVLEITESGSAPTTGIAVAEEPEVIDSVASVAPSSGETEQTASATTDMANVSQMISRLDDMNGKVVIDKDGELMGAITSIDYPADLAEVELTNGGVIGLPMQMLTELDNGLVAADLTDEEAFATAEQ